MSLWKDAQLELLFKHYRCTDEKHNRKYKATKCTERLKLCPAKRIMIIYIGHNFDLNFLTVL